MNYKVKKMANVLFNIVKSLAPSLGAQYNVIIHASDLTFNTKAAAK